jgi:pimeloyl-ACP methyl ester carboxylesterase
MATMARELASVFRVLETLQRGSGGDTLTVADHVADLREVVRSQASDARPAVVGFSWGATLALAFAAAHPDLVGPLVLICPAAIPV